MGNCRDFEWARERLMREKKEPNAYTANRANYLMREVERTDGRKAASELAKEFNSKKTRKA